MSTLFGRITEGFALDGANPTTGGIDDLIILFNKDEVSITFDPQNPLLVTGLVPKAGAKLYAFEGANNAFGTDSKQVMTDNGPRYEHEVDFSIAGNSTKIKQQLKGMGYGRVCAIVFNNFRSGDSAIELFGANNGLVPNEAGRNTADEASDGAYKLKLSRPQKLREPNWPAAVKMPGADGTYDTTKAALLALCVVAP